MNSLADGVLINILEFVRMDHIPKLTDVSRRFRKILATTAKDHWEEIRTKNLFPNLLKITCQNSVGTTALMLQASVQTSRCVQCMHHISRPHEFYGVRLCKQCQQLPHFLQSGLKKACKEYFLDGAEQLDNESLLKRKHGNSHVVLQHHVVRVATTNFSECVLQQKLEARKKRRRDVNSNRDMALQQRSKNVRRGYEFQSRHFKQARIDETLLGEANIDKLFDLVIKNSCFDTVFGDIFSHKVETRTKDDFVVKELIDFACMLTYMRKMNLVDDSYTELGEPLVKHVFKKYQNGLHFYEYVSEYASTKNAYELRVREVEQYIISSKLDKDSRKALSISMCAEDNIEYDEPEFEFFVNFGVGNPAEIARSVRQKHFLNDNNFMVHVTTNLQMGFGYFDSLKKAKERVLNRTLGYPPMKYVCRINLTKKHCRGCRGSEMQPPGTPPR